MVERRGLTERRPISEAPKDGTLLLCLTILGKTTGKHPEWNIGYHDPETGEWFAEEGYDIAPSHFYNLPDWRAGRAALAERGGSE